MAFMSTPKAQLPITSVVNLAASSRTSMQLFVDTNDSKYFSRVLEHSTIRENMSFSLPDVKVGDSLVLSGRHLSTSKENKCWESGSAYIEKFE